MKKWLCLLGVLCLFAFPALAQDYSLRGEDYTAHLEHDMDAYRDALDLMYTFNSKTIQWGEATDAGNDFALVDASMTGSDKMQFLYKKSTGQLYAASCLLQENIGIGYDAMFDAGVLMGNNLASIIAASIYLDVDYDADVFMTELTELDSEQSKVFQAISAFDKLERAEMEKGQVVDVIINGRVVTVYGLQQGDIYTIYLVYHALAGDTVSVPGL